MCVFVCLSLYVCVFAFVCVISPPPREHPACEPAGRPTLHPAPSFLQLFNPKKSKGRKIKINSLNSLFVRLLYIVIKWGLHSFKKFCSPCSSLALASSSAPFYEAASTACLTVLVPTGVKCPSLKKQIINNHPATGLDLGKSKIIEVHFWFH